MVKLKNREARMLVFELRHSEYCRANGHCACKRQRIGTTETRDGEKRHLVRMRSMPSTISLPARSEILVKDAVLKLPELQDAIRSGRIVPEVLPPVAAPTEGKRSKKSR